VTERLLFEEAGETLFGVLIMIELLSVNFSETLGDLLLLSEPLGQHLDRLLVALSEGLLPHGCLISGVLCDIDH
jgi:hypothetical protein